MSIETNVYWMSIDFLGLKTLLLGQFWGAPAHADIIEF